METPMDPLIDLPFKEMPEFDVLFR
jgi:hypothetical protein